MNLIPCPWKIVSSQRLTIMGISQQYRRQSVFALVLPTSGTNCIDIYIMETFFFIESKLLHRMRLLRFPVMEG